MEIKIPSENYDSLHKKIIALSNKADKLGLSEITLDIIYSIGEAIPKKDGSYKEISYLKVNVTGEPPVLKGSVLAGIIEPTDKGNVILEINDKIKIPEKYRHTDLCDCEHCGIKRDRTSAFIVMNEETNEFLQVGRVCLKSYTGDSDPKNIAFYESFFKLKEYSRHDNSPRIKRMYNVDQLLAFLIKGKELYPEINKEYLRNIILNNYVQDAFLHNKDLAEKRKEIAINIDDETYKKVEEFKNSIFKLSNTNNNNIWNYQLIMKDQYTDQAFLLLEVIDFKEAYDQKLTLQEVKIREELLRKQKEMEELEAKKSRVHVGVLGEKIQTKVTLDSVVPAYNEFGTSLVYTFRDENKNCIVWFNNGKALFSTDEQEIVIKDKKEFYIEGTVKKFNKYKDEAQTQFIRVKNLGDNLNIKQKNKNKI